MFQIIKTIGVGFSVAVGVFTSGHQTKPSVLTPISKNTVVIATSTVTSTTKNTTVNPSTNVNTKKSIPQTSLKNKKSKIVTKKQTVVVKAPEAPPDFVAINTFTRKAVVNILCSTKAGGLSPISGTGVVISPNGIILTNAHIGEYWLLRDLYQKNFLECVIRTGSPAYPQYNAELIYISPTWIKENQKLLIENTPKGTGENDFAFLRITSMIDGSALPASFPYLTPNVRENVDKDETVLLASYPAGFLGGLSILKGLNVTTAITTVQDIFTFKENTIDIISVGGTVISQKGSSGGAVVDGQSTIIGLISTSSNGDQTSTRDLRAITMAHINRSLQNELGITFSQFLASDLITFAKTFASTTAPTLTKLVSDPILNKN